MNVDMATYINKDPSQCGNTHRKAEKKKSKYLGHPPPLFVNNRDFPDIDWNLARVARLPLNLAAMLALFLFLATALRADAMDVTPVEKVIMMIKDLQTKVTREGNEKNELDICSW